VKRKKRETSSDYRGNNSGQPTRREKGGKGKRGAPPCLASWSEQMGEKKKK